MLKEVKTHFFRSVQNTVLILILMEHAQRDNYGNFTVGTVNVLILILMEHAQRELHNCRMTDYIDVLILILMEHAQRASTLTMMNLTRLS